MVYFKLYWYQIMVYYDHSDQMSSIFGEKSEKKLKRECYKRVLAAILAAVTLTLTACQKEAVVVPEEEPVETATEPAPEPEVSAEPEVPAVEEVPEEEPPEPEYLTHTAYMRGNDYFFHPDQPLTRAETAHLLTNLFEGDTQIATFADVDPAAWFAPSVGKMAQWLPGYEDGTYQPKAQITPAEFTAALLRLTEQEVTDSVEQAVALGWLEEAGEFVTRADATVILNRVLGRVPDKEALDQLETQSFLDVPSDHAAYYDILEACLTHEYLAEEGETWNRETIRDAQMGEGVYSSHAGAYYVDGEGNVVTQPGLYETDAATYLILEDGQAAVDGLYVMEDRVVYATEQGALLKNDLWGDYRFDEDGFYTSGDATLDANVAAALAACTTPEMTREEKLRAAYDYVRAFKYLGRNSALPTTCKTIPMENAVAYANKILETGKGDCYNFAASFCFLARALGYEATPIAGSCGYVWNTVAITHGWVEIVIDGETWLFDPQIENYNLRAGISNDLRSAYQVTYATAPANYYPN